MHFGALILALAVWMMRAEPAQSAAERGGGAIDAAKIAGRCLGFFLNPCELPCPIKPVRNGCSYLKSMDR
jgi:hypothetical protein